MGFGVWLGSGGAGFGNFRGGKCNFWLEFVLECSKFRCLSGKASHAKEQSRSFY